MENFSTTTGQHTNAVFGFTSMLINMLRDEHPTHIAVAFDVSRQTFRMEEYSEYKAKRNKSPDEFGGQLALIEEVLDALRIPYLKKPGFEADDIIATLTTQALADGMDVLILSGDRDAFQLVTERLHPALPDARRLGDGAAHPGHGRGQVRRRPRPLPRARRPGRRGLRQPARHPRGRPGHAAKWLNSRRLDNVIPPTVPKTPRTSAPKTAAKWIAHYDGLDNLITHADEIKGKAGDNLRAHLGDVIRNRRLNALVRDLELDLQPAELARQAWDRQEVHTLFDGLEFRVLRNRLFEEVGSVEILEEGGFELEGQALEPGTVGAWLAELGEERTGLHVRGTWGSGTGRSRAWAWPPRPAARPTSTPRR